MFCISCGKEIPENSTFCKYCGATQQAAEPTPEPTPEPQQQYHYEAPKNAINDIAKKDKKKKNVILIVCIVIVVLAFIGKMAQGSGESKDDTASAPDPIVTDTTAEPSEPEVSDEPTVDEADNADYIKIFRDRNIVNTPPVFMAKNTASFAKVEDDGSVDCLQFGYDENDIISDFEQTKYVDISGMSDSERAEMDQNVKAKLVDFEGLDFVKAEGNISSNYYILYCKISKLDDENNLATAKARGLVDTTGSGKYISMAITENNLLGEGYIKK